MRTRKRRRSRVGALSAVMLATLAAQPVGASPLDTEAAVAPTAQAQAAPPAPAPTGGVVRLSEEVVVQAVRAVVELVHGG